ncbi:hypothetical protein JGU71_28855 [Antrihabitans sp. YC3-6]|uniref:Uncharacterized protein n=1 Tax=Antrihabitans stalagmiti TaxID=2799499 RepID=A0A934NXA0_9NOCA|nr:hypothetical protein [Antrihabitans stalagmiti]MBJ8342907.1 hypothetical protein [Antrihabitans stalagmiti]
MTAAAAEGFTPVPDENLSAPSSLVQPPPPERRLGVWPEPVWTSRQHPPPLWWLIGAHGGAGVTMLEASWAPAADALGAFPGAHAGESPFMVIVARESATGLSRAHDLLTQHLAGVGGPAQLVGLVTVAAAPGRSAPQLRRRREVIAGLIEDRCWHIPWIDGWIGVTADEVPAWTPTSLISTTRRREPVTTVVPREVAEVGVDIRHTITNLLRPQRPSDITTK